MQNALRGTYYDDMERYHICDRRRGLLREVRFPALLVDFPDIFLYNTKVLLFEQYRQTAGTLLERNKNRDYKHRRIVRQEMEQGASE